MYRIRFLSLLFIAPVMLLLTGSSAFGASLGVQDAGKFFSDDAVSQANQIIHQINQAHHKDVLVETFPEIPSDMRGQYDQLGKDDFYEGWAKQLARQNAVDGLLILITRDPAHLHVVVGNNTRQHAFTLSDMGQLKTQLAGAFKQKEFDEGLVQGVQFIQQRMDANGTGSANRGMVPPTSGVPQNSAPPTYFPSAPHTEFHFGGVACLIVGVILFIVLVRAVFGRAGGGSYGRPGGYYPPQQGGYPPAGGYPMGGYPPQGGYGYGGSSGGFGRGFLGGLLGGAVGGYAADKWMGHGQAPGGGFIPPSSGGGADSGSGVDTSFSGGGADFGSSGPSGGGADFGGGGGSDFGGGGGGGDSGGSSGSDF